MTKKSVRASVPELPSSHLIALAEDGFTVINYLRESVEVRVKSTSNTRHEWLPQLCVAVGKDGKFRTIEWLPLGHPSNGYAFAGWSAQTQHTSGGVHRTVSEALSWFHWHDAQRSKDR